MVWLQRQLRGVLDGQHTQTCCNRYPNSLLRRHFRVTLSQTSSKVLAASSVHKIHTHSVYDVRTVCSQSRTNVNACLWLKSRWVSCIIFVRLEESIFRSAMSHPWWSFPHLLTSSPPQLAAVSGPRDLLQGNTVHRQPLPQEPLEPLQNNFLMNLYWQTQSGRKTTLKNKSQILKMRAPETCASTLPHVMTPKSLRPKISPQFR